MLCANCPYAIAKEEFYKAEFPITNIDFLLYSARYVKNFPRRDVLIVDEAHQK
jgi:Rad3-related DNA helicase